MAGSGIQLPWSHLSKISKYMMSTAVVWCTRNHKGERREALDPRSHCVYVALSHHVNPLNNTVI